MQVIEDFESRPHKAVTFVVQRGRERQELDEQKLPKAFTLDTAEEDYQDEARKRKVRKKEKKAKKEMKGRRKMRKSKELEVLRGWLSKDKTPYKGGIARRSRTKKKVGKKATQWEEEQQLDDLIERRRMKGELLKVGYLAKSP